MWWKKSLCGLVLMTLVAAGVPGTAGEAPDGSVTVNEWRGFLACGAMYPSAFTPVSCSWDPNHDDRRFFEPDADLKTVVVALVFDPEDGFMLHGNLSNHLIVNGTTVHRAQGGSPIEYRVDCEEGHALRDCASWSDLEFQFRVWVGNGELTSLNVAYQIPFTLHYDLYYGEHAPDGASALP